MNLIEKFEKQQMTDLLQGKEVASFNAGDTLRVQVKIVEGEKTRTQTFEGVCIARRNRGLGSSFTIRRLSFGEGVEQIFPVYSPLVSFEVIRRGDVRRAKLYYLRGRTGKAARIKEKKTWLSKKPVAVKA